MALTSQELGRRIRAAREASGLTQDEVAKHLAVSRPTIVNTEAGNRDVSSLELDKLAFLFGRDLREFLAETFHERDTLAALFRAQPSMGGHASVLEELRRCLAIGRELSNLENLVGIRRDAATLANYPFAPPKTRWDAIQQGKHLAEEERRRLGVGSGPLPDLIELLEAQGVRSAVVDLPEDISGLTLSDHNVGLFVVVNGVHPFLRQRFSFAHEYAHVLADRDRSGTISRVADRDELIEVRANSFAANLLMPEDCIRKFVASLGKGAPSRSYVEVFDEVESLQAEGRTQPGTQTIQLYDVVQLAYHFGVSRTSALYRLRNLRIVSQQEFKELKTRDDNGGGKQLARALGIVDQGKSNADGFKHRFIALGLEAYRRDEISYGKLKEVLHLIGLPASALDLLIQEAGLDGNLPDITS